MTTTKEGEPDTHVLVIEKKLARIVKAERRVSLVQGKLDSAKLRAKEAGEEFRGEDSQLHVLIAEAENQDPAEAVSAICRQERKRVDALAEWDRRKEVVKDLTVKRDEAVLALRQTITDAPQGELFPAGDGEPHEVEDEDEDGNGD